METVDQMLFSLFRITLVDDYQFDEMLAYDIVMTYTLVGTFLAISAILLVNLLIALLTETFQRYCYFVDDLIDVSEVNLFIAIL